MTDENATDAMDNTVPLQRQRPRSNAEFLKEQLAEYKDAKLEDLIIDDFDDDKVLGLCFLRPDGQRWVGWILCDPEGNGPGFIDLQLVDDGKPKPWPKVAAPAQFK